MILATTANPSPPPSPSLSLSFYPLFPALVHIFHGWLFVFRHSCLYLLRLWLVVLPSCLNLLRLWLVVLRSCLNILRLWLFVFRFCLCLVRLCLLAFVLVLILFVFDSLSFRSCLNLVRLWLFVSLSFRSCLNLVRLWYWLQLLPVSSPFSLCFSLFLPVISRLCSYFLWLTFCFPPFLSLSCSSLTCCPSFLS